LNSLRRPAIEKIAIFALGGYIYYIIKGALHCFKGVLAESSHEVGAYKTKLLKI